MTENVYGFRFCQHLSAKTLTFSELPRTFAKTVSIAHFVFDGLRFQKLAFRLNEKQDNEGAKAARGRKHNVNIAPRLDDNQKTTSRTSSIRRAKRASRNRFSSAAGAQECAHVCVEVRTCMNKHRHAHTHTCINVHTFTYIQSIHT